MALSDCRFTFHMFLRNTKIYGVIKRKRATLKTDFPGVKQYREEYRTQPSAGCTEDVLSKVQHVQWIRDWCCDTKFE